MPVIEPATELQVSRTLEHWCTPGCWASCIYFGSLSPSPVCRVRLRSSVWYKGLASTCWFVRAASSNLHAGREGTVVSTAGFLRLSAASGDSAGFHTLQAAADGMWLHSTVRVFMDSEASLPKEKRYLCLSVSWGTFRFHQIRLLASDQVF